MLYVANVFIASPGERGVKLPLRGLRVVGREVFGELDAGGDAALVELR